MPHQAKTGGIGLAQVSAALFTVGHHFSQQLALVESPMRVYARLVVGKGLQFGVSQKSQFGNAYAVLARNHAVQRSRQSHDAVNRFMRGLQHRVVIAVDRQIGVHIAVACMHMQSRPHTAFQYPLMGVVYGLAQRRKRGAIE